MPLVATANPLATPLEQLDREARSTIPAKGHYRLNIFCNNNNSSNSNSREMVFPFLIEDHFHLRQRRPTTVEPLAAAARTSTHSMQTSYHIL